MSDQKEQQVRKQPYEKPRLRVIELVAEEVLGVGCKTAGGGGPIVPPCVASGCVTIPGS